MTTPRIWAGTPALIFPTELIHGLISSYPWLQVCLDALPDLVNPCVDFVIITEGKVVDESLESEDTHNFEELDCNTHVRHGHDNPEQTPVELSFARLTQEIWSGSVIIIFLTRSQKRSWFCQRKAELSTSHMSF
jgi:hypothetical protein